MLRRKRKYNNDEDLTEDYYEEEDYDENFDDDDFDNDKTRVKDYDDSFAYGEVDDGDRTVITGARKKQEILGFIVVKKGKRKGDKFDLTSDDVIIGRSSRCCDILIDDEDVSKIHCRIRMDTDKNEFNFFDCGSTNGTMINGESVHHKVLKSHDIINIGESVELIFIQV